MAINLESAATGAASMLRADRRDAGARQDRWMMELEKAFVGGGKHDGAAAGQAPAAAQQGVQSAAPAVPHAGAPARAHARAGGLSAAALAHQRDGAQLPAGAIQVAPGGGSAPVHAGSMPLRAAGAVDQDATESTPQRAAGRLALAGAPVAGSPAQAALQFAAHQASHAAGSAPAPLNGKPFDQRAMHVFVDGQGVHAFIRDAALPASQLGAVAQSLAAELAAAGRQLATLTVNGRQVSARAAMRAEHDGFSEHGHAPAGANPTDYLIHPSFKGNP